jgi:glutamine synthetase
MTTPHDLQSTAPTPSQYDFNGLRGLMAWREVDTVLLAMPDMQGRMKGKRYGAVHFVR